MFTNTYLPHVGGVARSVKTLEDECRKRGHEVRVVAPEAEGAEESPHVLRLPAIQNFNGSDFSVRLPAPIMIRTFMDEFQPDIIHSHHPFLLGDTALREAWKSQVPIVFTHHTLYEQYTHYVPFDSDALKRAAIQLATEYCNLCDHIIAPSDSIAKLLGERGVIVPVDSIPTGIDTSHFSSGDGKGFREKSGIPADAIVLGHVGRLAKEKNLTFVSAAVKMRLEQCPGAYFVLVGDGSEKEPLRELLSEYVEKGRAIVTGSLSGQDLADAYASMDIFVFASQSETQGMVLAEAMSTGVPVVALDGPGVREIMAHNKNGLMLAGDASIEDFAAAIASLMDDAELRDRCADGALLAAQDYDRNVTADRVIDLYERMIAEFEHDPNEDGGPWDRFLNGIEIEWDLAVAKMSAVAAVVTEKPATEVKLD